MHIKSAMYILKMLFKCISAVVLYNVYNIIVNHVYDSSRKRKSTLKSQFSRFCCQSKEETRRMDYTDLAKVVLVGDSGVGKTCVLQRFAGEAFQHNHLATIGVDFKTRTEQIDDGRY